MFYKPEIRDKMQRRRKELSAVSVAQAAQAVAAQIVLLSEFLDAQNIGTYLTIENELDPMPVMQCAHQLKKKLYLPVIQATQSEEPLRFHAYTIGDPLLKGIHGISAPAHRTEFAYDISKLDIIFLPLVAFDAQCNRLGRGAGHYDRALNHLKKQHKRPPCLIGLAYEFQHIPEIVIDKWDVPMDLVVTEKNVYRRN